MRVVALFGLILGVVQRDSYSASLFFRRIVNLIDVLFLVDKPFELKDVHDRSSQRGLSMINVADGSDIHVWLGALEFCFFCHIFY